MEAPYVNPGTSDAQREGSPGSRWRFIATVEAEIEPSSVADYALTELAPGIVLF